MDSKQGNCSCGVVICAEEGILERQSRLLVRSMRRWVNDFPILNIYCFSPRGRYHFSKKTLFDFKNSGIELIKDPLNTNYHSYPFANKILACVYAEKKFHEDYLLFLDSDQVFFNSFKPAFEYGSKDFFLRPAEKKGIAFASKDDDNYKYWRHLFNIFNIEETYFVNTAIQNQAVNAYWNAGFILARRNNGFFEGWFDTFSYLFEKQLVPENDFTFLDQIALSLFIQKNNLSCANLDSRFSYPYIDSNEIDSSLRINQVEDLISLHYHKLFSGLVDPNRLFSGFETDTAKFAWLMKELKSVGLFPQSVFFKIKHYYYSFTK